MDGSFFSALLTALGVKHTAAYSDRRFASMPFRTLFGLSNLLKEYGVESRGVRLADKKDLLSLKPPFVLPVKHTYVIVKEVNPSCISYESVRTAETMPLADFLPAWDGVAFLVHSDPDACEPDYGKHLLAQVMVKLRNIALPLAMLALIVWLMVRGGAASSLSTIALAVCYLAGLWLSFLLVQKTVGVSSSAADKVCKILREGGCDTISRSDASSFLGIFHWSEVGFSFFSVSLFTLLLCPALLPALAIYNILALPYTVWSITYQRFKAHTWCTMCVGVQICLWLCFFCLWWSGALSGIFPLRCDWLLPALGYVVVMLALSKIDAFLTPAIEAYNQKDS